MIKKLFFITILFFSSNGWTQVSIISCELTGKSNYDERSIKYSSEKTTTPLKINIEISMEKDFDGEEIVNNTMINQDGVKSMMWTDMLESKIDFTDEKISLFFYIPKGPHPKYNSDKIRHYELNITLNRYTGKGYFVGDIQGSNVITDYDGDYLLHTTEFLNATGNCSTSKERKF